MISVTFKVNGRDVPAHRLGDAIGDLLRTNMQDIVRNHVNQRLGSLRCTVHGRAPSITAWGAGDRWTLTAHACCKALEEQATRALK